MNIIQTAIKQAGGFTAVAAVHDLTPTAVFKWGRAGLLPRTEYTGETSYAKTIERLQRSRKVAKEDLITRKQMLETRSKGSPPHA